MCRIIKGRHTLRGKVAGPLNIVPPLADRKQVWPPLTGTAVMNRIGPAMGSAAVLAPAMARGYVKLNVGDVAELRKPHACGHNAWRLIRKGIDIRIECLGCGHRVLLPREKFVSRLKCLRPAQT